MVNLESDNSSLVALVTWLKNMILDKDSHFADVLYHQRCYKKFTEDFKPAESYREDKDKVEKATNEKKSF